MSTEPSNIGQELYERICVWTGHILDLRKNLEKATEAYNKSIGSLESRVLVTARKLKELGASGADIKEIEPIDVAHRQIQIQDTFAAGS